MTNTKHRRNARKWNMSEVDYAELRHKARISLDRRLKKTK